MKKKFPLSETQYANLFFPTKMFIARTSRLLTKKLVISKNNIKKFSTQGTEPGGINYLLGPQQQQIFDLARKFAIDEIVPK